MYKTVVLTKFRDDLDTEEVRRWWRDVHGPMARSTPGLIRYVQNYWTEAADPRMFGGATPVRAYDGHADMWWESREAFDAAMDSDEWKATVADGPTGFASGTLIGGVIEEEVICWDER